MSPRKLALLCDAFITTTLAIDIAYAKAANMEPYYFEGQLLREEHVYKVKSPIRTMISFISTPDEIQKSIT